MTRESAVARSVMGQSGSPAPVHFTLHGSWGTAGEAWPLARTSTLTVVRPHLRETSTIARRVLRMESFRVGTGAGLRGLETRFRGLQAGEPDVGLSAELLPLVVEPLFLVRGAVVA